MGKSLLIIGLVWPEPKSTAAGRRMMQLIKLFQKHQFNITFASSSLKTERSSSLSDLGIEEVSIRLNDSSFQIFLKDLAPEIVIFDRFITEEQFGWKVMEHCPNALRILDTEDLHFLREARKEAVEGKGNLDNLYFDSDIAKREVASIYRSDLSLIISSYEMNLLKATFNIHKDLLFYLPFLIDRSELLEKSNLPNFEARSHFITVGNFKHAPNSDSIFYLKQSIWPLIRSQLPSVKLYVYGAYANHNIKALHDEDEGFLIKGPINNIDMAMSQARVCLAPLRYGAGLKGKVIEAFLNGTPCVMTSIAAEGIITDSDRCKFVQEEPRKLAETAIELYNDKGKWEQASTKGLTIIRDNFLIDDFEDNFLDKCNFLLEHIKEHRSSNFIGLMLNHHSMQSTKYLGKWIEEKNK